MQWRHGIRHCQAKGKAWGSPVLPTGATGKRERPAVFRAKSVAQRRILLHAMVDARLAVDPYGASTLFILAAVLATTTQDRLAAFRVGKELSGHTGTQFDSETFCEK
eukprot:COSAG02_NODE_214_length_28689_cov_34.895523_2_plen_107_part_00